MKHETSKPEVESIHSLDEIRQALEKTTLTKTIEPDAYADAAQQFVDEYGTDLHMLLGEDDPQKNSDCAITMQ
ncbi:MAG: hypothetical protein EOO69_00850 [Moraxellaceae bacterium]|nr:MAG: hypothetical protein EOO69_00850 [Moraxellaceae bacterium]